MKKIKEVLVIIYYDDGLRQCESYNNTQDAQSHLQTKKCYNKEKRHQ